MEDKRLCLNEDFPKRFVQSESGPSEKGRTNLQIIQFVPSEYTPVYLNLVIGLETNVTTLVGLNFLCVKLLGLTALG